MSDGTYPLMSWSVAEIGGPIGVPILLFSLILAQLETSSLSGHVLRMYGFSGTLVT